jgi:ANTAR domain
VAEPASPGYSLPVLGDLRRSAEPAVVLSSLARLSVPSFSQRCTVELSEGLDPVFTVSYPLSAPDTMPEARPPDDQAPPGAGPAGEAVITSFRMPSAVGQPSFAGYLIHTWTLRAPAPGDAMIARLLVDHALEVVRYERLAETAAAAESRSAQLALDAMTARVIGEATGIIMAALQLSEAAAVSQLKAAGHRSGHTLHDVAREVVRTGIFTREPDQPDAAPSTIISLAPVSGASRDRARTRPRRHL